jgi:hypothetical protein
MHFFTCNPNTYHLHQPYFNSYIWHKQLPWTPTPPSSATSPAADTPTGGGHHHHRWIYFFCQKKYSLKFLVHFPFFFPIVFHLPFLKKLHLICADLELSLQVLFLLVLDLVFVKVGLNIFSDFVNKTLLVALFFRSFKDTWSCVWVAPRKRKQILQDEKLQIKMVNLGERIVD